MVAIEHPEVIEGRRMLIATDLLDSEEAAEYGSIDNDGAALDEEYDSGSGETGVCLSICRSGLRGPLAFSLLGCGVPSQSIG